MCGIVPNVLASRNRRFGYRGVVCYLYTNKESKAQRITSKVSILTEIARIASRLDRKKFDVSRTTSNVIGDKRTSIEHWGTTTLSNFMALLAL